MTGSRSDWGYRIAAGHSKRKLAFVTFSIYRFALGAVWRNFDSPSSLMSLTNFGAG